MNKKFKPKYRPGTFQIALTEECLVIGRELGLAGAGLVVTTLLRKRWEYQLKHHKGEPFSLGNEAVAKYGVSDKKRRAILRQMEAEGWIKIDNGKSGKACLITVLKEF